MLTKSEFSLMAGINVTLHLIWRAIVFSMADEKLADGLEVVWRNQRNELETNSFNDECPGNCIMYVRISLFVNCYGHRHIAVPRGWKIARTCLVWMCDVEIRALCYVKALYILFFYLPGLTLTKFYLGDADQLQKALTVLFEMKREGLPPNSITYSTLLVASEK